VAPLSRRLHDYGVKGYRLDSRRLISHLVRVACHTTRRRVPQCPRDLQLLRHSGTASAADIKEAWKLF